MNHGVIKCCGSPIFLKNKFGSGYILIISKGNGFNVDQFFKIIHENVREYKIENDSLTEIKISIPYELSGLLPNLLNQIEKQKDSIGITSCGVNTSTIEEVFLKFGSIDQENKVIDKVDNLFKEECKKKLGFGLWFQQIEALLIKRFHLFRRRYVLAISTFVLPILLTIIFIKIIIITEPSNKTIESENQTLKFSNDRNFTMPYKITEKGSSFNNFMKNFYSNSNVIKIHQLEDDDNVESFILEKRKNSVKNLVDNFFGGMSIKLENSTTISNIHTYYSSLEYLSSENIINELTNLLLTCILQFK